MGVGFGYTEYTDTFNRKYVNNVINFKKTQIKDSVKTKLSDIISKGYSYNKYIKICKYSVEALEIVKKCLFCKNFLCKIKVFKRIKKHIHVKFFHNDYVDKIKEKFNKLVNKSLKKQINHVCLNSEISLKKKLKVLCLTHNYNIIFEDYGYNFKCKVYGWHVYKKRLDFGNEENVKNGKYCIFTMLEY
ncbi:hypothetical protein [Acanthamoeba castellanii mimivirus]|jgi:hypothetical protein|uniref:Uncharacterized protein L334 n=5 Tax=Mimivirus TaxID=315393 RepID=YL334_MIMIV|nr:hypothetical protein MIMI_gp0363 [Acanthamoeba polyphaga mimivirus]Q5UQR9.1 RecName: Full=Uncharacterized protein L334 [Acanthamoeba polyphaga mimivirus]AEQ60522.1 hypothetical protein [Acanthamoeba castellanii mamavirus]AHA45530.1 hypothetical protein HIRU_S624 [Hirudovirus strain Sangsue]ALR83914.1 hypothetical protein [Niemeyer virus]AMK61862.1 hypothetical protein [Samba virus]AMZ02780.1 hypothetical protein [Mimivirus Bombay]QTF49247.1 hypothetical protein [Mimivirus reunion]WMV6169